MSYSRRSSRLSALALGFMALMWVSPFTWLFSNAFDPLADGTLGLPQAVGLDNFADAMSGRSGRQMINSLVLAVATSTLTVVIATAAAYSLSRMKIPGQNTFLWALVLLRMLPPTGVIVPLYFTAQATGMLNMWGVVVSITILNLPFAMLLLKNFFDSVPVELEEAAFVDGVSLTKTILYVVLPLARPGLAVVWFFAFTGAWNEFLLPLIFVRHEAGFPMSVGLYAAFGTNSSTAYGFLAAYSILYAIPAVGVYFLLKRNMNTGFAGVGVKG